MNVADRKIVMDKRGRCDGFRNGCVFVNPGGFVYCFIIFAMRMKELLDQMQLKSMDWWCLEINCLFYKHISLLLNADNICNDGLNVFISNVAKSSLKKMRKYEI